jgi:hypothetical protein
MLAVIIGPLPEPSASRFRSLGVADVSLMWSARIITPARLTGFLIPASGLMKSDVWLMFKRPADFVRGACTHGVHPDQHVPQISLSGR